MTPGGEGAGPLSGRGEAVLPGFTPSGSIRMLFSAPPPPAHVPALFLDRDGVINERIAGGYVTDWADFRFMPGITEALRALSSLALPVIVVSNQAGVGKGLLTAGKLADITRRFVEALDRSRARIDAVYYCPHTPAAGCPCRKPRPGLLEAAAVDWNLDLGSSVLVGDSASDAAAAQAAGCQAITLSSEPPPAAGEAARSVWLSQPGLLLPEVVRLLGIAGRR